MYLKNFSLLYAPGGDVRLSPAYDLLPTTLLLPEDKEEMALTLNGKKRKLKVIDFQCFGAALMLTDRQIVNSFERMMAAVPLGLDQMGKSFCSAENKSRYCELVLERVSRLRYIRFKI